METIKTRDTWNPETWTDKDREFLDAARQLTPDEQQLIIDMLQIMNAAEPARREAMQNFVLQQAGNYRLRTAEGRAAFLEALQAV